MIVTRYSTLLSMQLEALSYYLQDDDWIGAVDFNAKYLRYRKIKGFMFDHIPVEKTGIILNFEE